MKQLLCLSDKPWSARPGRAQQLLSRLRDAQILYFSPAGSENDDERSRTGRKVRPNVTVCTLPAPLLPAAVNSTHLFLLEQLRQARFISKCAARHGFHAPLLWTTCPRQVHLLDELDYDALVYDCDREWDDLPLDWEGSLANAADVVFAASPGLVERLSPCSENIALLPNGVNYPLFSGAGAVRRFDPLPRLKGPLLGFAGALNEALDLSPILYAARVRPEWTFLLLGERRGNPLLSKLKKLPNVLFAGPCPLTEAPDWLLRCDVLLDLLDVTRPYSDVVSTRMYEYLATGRPIVSMLWPEQVERFPDVVYGAYASEDFVTLCAHALEEAPGFVSQRRQSRAKAAEWPLRADEVSRILTTAGLL